MLGIRISVVVSLDPTLSKQVDSLIEVFTPANIDKLNTVLGGLETSNGALSEVIDANK